MLAEGGVLLVQAGLLLIQCNVACGADSTRNGIQCTGACTCHDASLLQALRSVHDIVRQAAALSAARCITSMCDIAPGAVAHQWVAAPRRPGDVTDKPADGGQRQGSEEREVVACHIAASQPDVCVAGPPDKAVEEVEVLESLAYHAMAS